MKAYDKFYALDLKMEKLLGDKQLVHEFSKNKRFPLTMTIRPDNALDAQMELYSQDGSVPSPDAKWIITFKSLDKDDIDSCTDDRLPINEGLRSQILNLTKKMVMAYLFGYFAEQFTVQNGDDINYTGSANSADPGEVGSEDDPDMFDDFYEDDEDDLGEAPEEETETDGAEE